MMKVGFLNSISKHPVWVDDALISIIIDNVSWPFFPKQFLITEEGEIFQVKKSSHSKKVMKMMDKERKKKKSSHKDSHSTSNAYNDNQSDSNQQSVRSVAIDSENSGKRNNSNNSNSIQTEIRTDDFVVRLLLSISLLFLYEMKKIIHLLATPLGNDSITQWLIVLKI